MLTLQGITEEVEETEAGVCSSRGERRRVQPTCNHDDIRGIRAQGAAKQQTVSMLALVTWKFTRRKMAGV